MTAIGPLREPLRAASGSFVMAAFSSCKLPDCTERPRELVGVGPIPLGPIEKAQHHFGGASWLGAAFSPARSVGALGNGASMH